MQALIQSRRKIRPFVIMDTVLFLLHIRGLIPLLVFYFRVEENFAGGNFRWRKISRNSIRGGYCIRGRTISRKIKIREYSENFLHAKNWCYTVLQELFCGLCPFPCLANSPVHLHSFHFSLPCRIISYSSVLDSLITRLRFARVDFSKCTMRRHLCAFCATTRHLQAGVHRCLTID